jgi:hypothetical protein
MTFSIDVNQIFGYADDIVTAMMPVVYVVAGLSLGFVVVSKIISAFR